MYVCQLLFKWEYNVLSLFLNFHIGDLNYQKIGEALTGLEWGNKTTKCGNKESRAIIEST